MTLSILKNMLPRIPSTSCYSCSSSSSSPLTPIISDLHDFFEEQMQRRGHNAAFNLHDLQNLLPILSRYQKTLGQTSLIASTTNLPIAIINTLLPNQAHNISADLLSTILTTYVQESKDDVLMYFLTYINLETWTNYISKLSTPQCIDCLSKYAEIPTIQKNIMQFLITLLKNHEELSQNDRTNISKLIKNTGGVCAVFKQIINYSNPEITGCLQLVSRISEKISLKEKAELLQLVLTTHANKHFSIPTEFAELLIPFILPDDESKLPAFDIDPTSIRNLVDQYFAVSTFPNKGAILKHWLAGIPEHKKLVCVKQMMDERFCNSLFSSNAATQTHAQPAVQLFQNLVLPFFTTTKVTEQTVADMYTHLHAKKTTELENFLDYFPKECQLSLLEAAIQSIKISPRCNALILQIFRQKSCYLEKEMNVEETAKQLKALLAKENNTEKQPQSEKLLDDATKITQVQVLTVLESFYSLLSKLLNLGELGELRISYYAAKESTAKDLKNSIEQEEGRVRLYKSDSDSDCSQYSLSSTDSKFFAAKFRDQKMADKCQTNDGRNESLPLRAFCVVGTR